MNNLDFLFLGSDHAGFQLKEELATYIKNMFPKTAIINLGCFEEVSNDYPDIILDFKKALKKMKTKVDFDKPIAIFICGTGIGMSIASNKIKKIRSAVCNDMDSIFAAKLHNNINVLCMGERVVKNSATSISILEAFLKLEFEKLPRHVRRLKKINKI